MSILQIISFVFVTTIMVTKIKANGDIFQSGHKELEFGLSPPEKRRDNFRVPVDMPFDPKFWPARGRRADAEFHFNRKTCDILGCLVQITGEVNDRRTTGKPETRWKIGSNCSDLLDAIIAYISNECGRFVPSPVSAVVEFVPETIGKYTTDRQKRPSYIDALPEYVWAKEKSPLGKPDLSYQEKEKKQNIFWVSRGRRSVV